MLLRLSGIRLTTLAAKQIVVGTLTLTGSICDGMDCALLGCDAM
jgi:hypothetical protein